MVLATAWAFIDNLSHDRIPVRTRHGNASTAVPGTIPVGA
jgi:hypothetical protein